MCVEWWMCRILLASEEERKWAEETARAKRQSSLEVHVMSEKEK